MTAIGPGTPLIAKQTYTAPIVNTTIYEGSLYFCLEVELPPLCLLDCCHDKCGLPGIRLKDIQQDYVDDDGKEWEWWWCPNLFRPLNDGDTSLVDDMEGINYIILTPVSHSQPEKV